MPKVVPPCPTKADALKQALVAAVTDERGGTVTDVTFGRFADLEAGWYWHIDFTRTVASDHPNLRRTPDDTERKIHCVVEKWLLDTARYEERESS